jgi:hypothetical protein
MTTEKQFKQMVRALAKRTGKSYAATRARLEKRRRKANLFGEAAKVLRGLTEENIRWVFRHDPDLASLLVDKSSRHVTHRQLDFLQGKLDDLQFSMDRRDILAATLIEQYDAYVARGGRTSTHLTSRTLFEAGVEPMYFRFMGTKIEACIGELGRAVNSVALFQSEVEPLLRHIQKVQGSELIELLEIVPRLGLKLFPHLKTSGWCRSDPWQASGGHGIRWAQSYCRNGIDTAPMLPPVLEETLTRWDTERRAYVEARFSNYTVTSRK